jgi:lipid II:glycine glycyltransferase (peptidoglycan interpeptide bridge formation enzyme)
MSSAGAPDAAPGSPEAGRPWHFLQSELWAQHKAAFGWSAVRVAAEELPGASSQLLCLTRRLPGGFVLTYVPYGPACPNEAGSPGVPGPHAADALEAAEAVAPRVAQEVRASFGTVPTLVRFDLPQEASDADRPEGPLRRAPIDVQPPDTVILDLSRDEDQLLARMHKKNRYNIRLAARKGVSVSEADPGRLGEWYELYRETAHRDGIAIHSRQYYERLFELAADGETTLRLYLAEHDRDLLAGIVVVHHGAGATYLYGASSNLKRNLMPNYALQWYAIREAREAGLLWYDLFGIPPADDPRHPMHGLFRFKNGFGGRLVHRLGGWDAPVRRMQTRLYHLAERARDVYFHRVRRYVTR